MKMRSIARWALAGVLAVDLVVALALFGGWVSSAVRATTGQGGPAEQDVEWISKPNPDVLERLGRQLAEQRAELERRESEVTELLRGSEVLRRAGLLPDQAAAEPEEETGPDPAVAQRKTERREAAFDSLKKAYENMEPESAALALAQLAGRDKQAVVQLLLGWKPRTSGAILDALTQSNPAMSADLSYEIWKVGREEPSAAK